MGVRECGGEEAWVNIHNDAKAESSFLDNKFASFNRPFKVLLK